MNTGQFKLKMLLWEMRFWPVKRGSCLIKEAIKTGLTTCIQVQPVSVPGERGGGWRGGRNTPVLAVLVVKPKNFMSELTDQFHLLRLSFILPSSFPP